MGEDCNAGTWFSTPSRRSSGMRCATNVEWLNGLSNPIGESYHPKTTGHANGYYPVVHSTTG